MSPPVPPPLLPLSSRSRLFPTSRIQQLSLLATQRSAVNLAEGFPDFPPPALLTALAADALTQDNGLLNQYGEDELLLSGAARLHKLAGGPSYSHENGEVVATVGQTEAMALAMLAVCNEGDAVVLFEPVFETYAPLVSAAGGHVLRAVLSERNGWRVTREVLDKALASAEGRNVCAIVVNCPANPTGRVLRDDEYQAIADVCKQHGMWAVVDGVYEHFVYCERSTTTPHLASLPGMRERTIYTSSASKVLGATGWRVGWAFGPPHVVSVLSRMQVKLTDTVPRPFQHAVGRFLTEPGVLESYLEEMRAAYRERRDLVLSTVQRAGFVVHDSAPEGGIFVYAKLPSSLRASITSEDLCTMLIDDVGVSACPGSNFVFSASDADVCDDGVYVRFAFCKGIQTLQMAQRKFDEHGNKLLRSM